MRSRMIILCYLLFVLILSACGPSKAELSAIATQTAAVPTSTATPEPTITATPPPGAVVVIDTLSLREGPGSEFDVKGKLTLNEELDVLDRNGDCTWLKVKNRNRTAIGWVANREQYLELRVDCAEITRGPFRPATGIFRPNQRGGGKGELSIENGSSRDAIVVMVYNDTPTVGAYIRFNESFTISGITDGFYDVYFSTGTNWNGEKFTSDAQFERFDTTLMFTTDSTTYSTWSITLQPVIGGNASTDEITASEFPDLGD